MPKKQKPPDEPLTEREQVQGLALSLGRALALTITAGMLEPGHRLEDTAIKAMDEAWIDLAGQLHDFAEGHA